MTGEYIQYIKNLIEAKTYLNALAAGFGVFNLSESEASDLLEIINKILLMEIGLDDIKKELSEYIIRDREELKKIHRAIYLFVLIFVKDVYPEDIYKSFVKIGGTKEDILHNYELYKNDIEDDMRLLELRDIGDEIEKAEDEKEYSVDNTKKLLDKAILVEDFEKERIEYLDLFKKRLSVVFNMEDQLSLAVINHRLIVTLDKLGSRFYNDLKRTFSLNSEKLTETNITVNNQKEVGSIKNWLFDFKNYLQEDQVISKLLIAQYLATSPNVKNLSDKDKQLIAKLLDTFYMIDQLPKSLTDLPIDQWYIFPVKHEEASISKVDDLQKALAEKLESVDIAKPKKVKEKNKTEDHITKDHKNKKLSTIKISKDKINKDNLNVEVKKEKEFIKQDKKRKVEEKVSNPLDKKKENKKIKVLTEAEIRNKYIGDKVENEAIVAAINKVSKMTGQSSRQLIDILIKNLEDKDKDKVKIIAILKVLAETKKIGDLLKDERVKEKLNNYAKNENLDGIINVIIKQDKNEYLLIYILKAILEYYIGLSGDEAARIGLQIANVNKRVEAEFVNLARFNMQNGEFEWNL